ncbi:MAG: imidazoleglycerol-phosphate dehydratase HisB [Eubacteriaceae bacterium]|jgi:imidazoleglycerol-phosphate dehydratase|nr:imidazoleglycerol-phosphate dehydratase HisB [Eubacteriaceae bacterium]
MRTALIERNTGETKIRLALSLDSGEDATVSTGIGFFDHMLALFGKHSGFGLNISCAGDTHVDSHHTVEDTGIALGLALKKALGDKMGIERYGFASIPMDEALVNCTVDFSGRSFLTYSVSFPSEKLGEMEAESVREFFLALSSNAQMNLHLSLLYGQNSHHIAECAFKAAARAMRDASRLTGTGLPSTKGVL